MGNGVYYCECVNDAGGKFHPFLVYAWTEGSSLLLFSSLFPFAVISLLINYISSSSSSSSSTSTQFGDN